MSSLTPLDDQCHDGQVAESSTGPRSDRYPGGSNKEKERGVAVGEGKMAQEGFGSRRHRKQASSSFRLESPGEFKRPTASATTPKQSLRSGKLRSNDAEQLAQNNQAHHHRHRSRPSVGGSPLAKTVTNASPAADNSQGSTTPSSRTYTSNSLDKDTAQIVNLALNLSESRKRSNSAKLLASPALRERRFSSARDFSGPRERSQQYTSETHGDQPQGLDPPWRPNIPSHPVPEASQIHVDEHYDFSDATLARAEKARKHFELFSEYLRLLPHLPPLHAQGQRREFAIPNQAPDDRREYNPLQYIRNRKIRFRERSAINTDAGGWEDIERVHYWVDAILFPQEHRDHHPPDQRPRLPSLKPDHSSNEASNVMSPSSPPTARPIGGDTNKPRRPRVDWMLSPASLLADAAWLEDRSNRLKIEDREGNKVFPPGSEFTVMPLLGSDETPTGAEQEDEKVKHESLQVRAESELPSKDTQRHQSNSRGRRSHRFPHPMSFTPSHSLSRTTSKSRWRKALTRSSSTDSSSTDSDGGSWKINASTKLNYSADHKDLPHEIPTTDAQVSLTPENQHGLEPNKLNVNQRQRLPRLSIPSNGSENSPAVSQDRNHAHSPKSAASDSNRDGARASIDSESAPNSPTRASNFPSIAINLSPPRSRSVSPGQISRPLSRNRKQEKEPSRERETATEDIVLDSDASGIHSAHPVTLRDPQDDWFRPPDFRRIESFPVKLLKGASNQESKIRGMFKGGRIAELVNNEVSKVGDFIWKRDPPGHSRHSSSASSVVSDHGLTDDDIGSRKDKQGDSEDLLQHYRESSAESQPLGQDRLHVPEDTSSHRTGSATPRQLGDTSQVESGSETERVKSNPSSRSQLRTPENPRPGVVRGQITRPRLSEATRNWSLSSRSITKVSDSQRVGKRDIAAIRAHLLSSGTKALQIRRRAEIPDNLGPATTFCDPSSSIMLHAVTSGEFVNMSRSLVAGLDKRIGAVQKSMSTLSEDKVPSLLSDFERLETLVSSSLATRMRTMTQEAEDLTSELTTTSTLALKQLNDSLDKGIRKRNRRFRRVSRLGFVLLEWFLVGAMWCVWMIVMVLRMARGLWRGALSGVRWILWL